MLTDGVGRLWDKTSGGEMVDIRSAVLSAPSGPTVGGPRQISVTAPGRSEQRLRVRTMGLKRRRMNQEVVAQDAEAEDAEAGDADEAGDPAMDEFWADWLQDDPAAILHEADEEGDGVADDADEAPDLAADAAVLRRPAGLVDAALQQFQQFFDALQQHQ